MHKSILLILVFVTQLFTRSVLAEPSRPPDAFGEGQAATDVTTASQDPNTQAAIITLPVQLCAVACAPLGPALVPPVGRPLAGIYSPIGCPPTLPPLALPLLTSFPATPLPGLCCCY